MIDLTPLDVRKKKGDFRRSMRGYDPVVVDDFLDLVADRLEEVVRENAMLRERAGHLNQSVETFRERERALNEALISAQQLREEVSTQAAREAELTLREARSEAERILDEARRESTAMKEATRRVQRQRANYLRALRNLVQRQLAEVEQEEERLHDLSRADAELPSGAATGETPNPDLSWLAAIEEPRSGEE